MKRPLKSIHGRSKSLLVAGCIIGVVVFVAFTLTAPRSNSEESQRPHLSGRTLEDKPLSLESYYGRPVLVNFWASWCVPCRDEFPVLAGAPSSVQVIGVLVNDDPAAARDFASKYNANWPTVTDTNGSIAQTWGSGKALPVTFVLDSEGTVQGKHYGGLRTADLQSLLGLVGISS